MTLTHCFQIINLPEDVTAEERELLSDVLRNQGRQRGTLMTQIAIALSEDLRGSSRSSSCNSLMSLRSRLRAAEAQLTVQHSAILRLSHAALSASARLRAHSTACADDTQ